MLLERSECTDHCRTRGGRRRGDAPLVRTVAQTRRDGAIPEYRAKPLYGATTFGMIWIGGAMPILYVQGSASALLCFHLGAATPVIVQKIAANVPSPVTHQGPGEASLRDFFRW
jgi:hypothetical protein